MPVPTALFICVHNAGRSQIAEALFNAYAGGKAVATSAGVEPVGALNLNVIAAMREAGYDVRSQRPKLLTDEMIEAADHVITLGCMEDEACPAVLAEDDWGIDDPAGAPLPKVMQIRDEIARRVRKLLREMGIEPVR
ncbi:MAG: arsenate reductase ArsC [Actinobacteria bacterium]|nr:MAG: arsenate reductase ArsC [Actinomycetota bacterium]